MTSGNVFPVLYLSKVSAHDPNRHHGNAGLILLMLLSLLPLFKKIAANIKNRDILNFFRAIFF
ncbi:MAG: hypothetical protein K2P38_07910 [Lachnospiraceae bacterium]|nr:hypothetical protein [Lachnospiraceae bacterium]